MTKVRFDRTPYTVRYTKDGQTHKIRRVPPPKLHPVDAGDTVTITRKKGDDWDAGDKVRVKAVSPRQPNTLMVERPDGLTTFLPYFDVAFKGRPEPEISEDEPSAGGSGSIGSRYLLWP